MNNNGRVPEVDLRHPSAAFPLFVDAAGQRAGALARGGMTHLLKPSKVSDLFFSDMNSDALQDAIRYQVFVRSDQLYTIGRQSETELSAIMRSVFLEYGRNIQSDVLAQVRDLNARVLDFAVPQVLQEVRAYKQYLRDASTLPVPLDHARLLTTAGTRTLEMRPGMF